MFSGLALPWEHLTAPKGQELRYYGVEVAGGFVGGFMAGSVVANMGAGIIGRAGAPAWVGAYVPAAVTALVFAKGWGPLGNLPVGARAWAAGGALAAGVLQRQIAEQLVKLPLVGPLLGKALNMGGGTGDLYDDAFNPMVYANEGATGEFYAAPVDAYIQVDDGMDEGTDAYIQVDDGMGGGTDAYIQVDDNLGEFYAAPTDGVGEYVQTGPGNFEQPSVDGFYQPSVDGLESVDGMAGEEELDAADVQGNLGHGFWSSNLRWGKFRMEKAQALKAKYGAAAKIYRCDQPGYAIVGIPRGGDNVSRGVPISRSVPPQQPVSMHVPAQFPVMPASQAPSIRAQQKGVFSEGVFGGSSPHAFS